MEARKITIVSTNNQRKSVLMSSATTLKELKEDLRNEGIDYTDMTFYEGTSKVELKDDSAILPHDVPYKGTVTNELVFMLTNTNKKIKSGADMTRAEAYDAIRNNNLQSECVKRFGKNFTMCKTANLVALVNEKTTEVKASTVKEKTKVNTPKDTKKEDTLIEYVDIKARKAINSLLDMLKSNGTLWDDEIDEVRNILGYIDNTCNPDEKTPYSDREIDEMFDFVRK